MEKIIFDALFYIGQIVLLWIIADFITGMVHWWQDTYGKPTWPILGTHLVVPNLVHHDKPRAMVKNSYWIQVRASVIAAVILSTVLWFSGWHSWQMLLCLAFSSQGNRVHAFAHQTQKENGKLITWLQKVGLFQGKRMHGWHHKAPYDTNFFILTNYLNPLFNRIHFFEGLEWFLEKIFKIKTVRGTDVRNGV